MSGFDFKGFAEQSARELFAPPAGFVEQTVSDVLTKHGIGHHRAEPKCSVCGAVMRCVKDDLYQCSKCMRLEVL